MTDSPLMERYPGGINDLLPRLACLRFCLPSHAHSPGLDDLSPNTRRSFGIAGGALLESELSFVEIIIEYQELIEVDVPTHTATSMLEEQPAGQHPPIRGQTTCWSQPVLAQ